MYTNMDVAKQSAPHLNLTQNSHFNNCRSSNFYETLKNGFFDLKDIRINTIINQIGCKTKYMTQNGTSMTPPPPPGLLVRIRFFSFFWSILVSFFSANFNKKRRQNAQETKLHQIRYMHLYTRLRIRVFYLYP